MNQVHRFMVVPDAHRAHAKELVAKIAGQVQADGMWNSGLSATGAAPATHWAACGFIDAQFAAILGDAALTFGAYQQAGGTLLTLSDVQSLYLAAPVGTYIRDDTYGQELTGTAQLGLQLVQGGV